MTQLRSPSGTSLRALVCVLSLLLSLSALAGCQGAPEEIPPDLSRMEMFQRAQEAADRNQWDLALRYYREFSQRFPEDRGAIMEAEYEIAFISYKQRDYTEARQRFLAILATYEEDTSGSLPEWPRVLANRLLEIIAERTEGDQSGGTEPDGNDPEGEGNDPEGNEDDTQPL